MTDLSASMEVAPEGGAPAPETAPMAMASAGPSAGLGAAAGLPSATGPTTAAASAPTAERSLDLLHGVEMTVTVELGRTKMLLRDLLALQTGSVIELDRAAGSPVDVLINDNLLARGEVVVLDDEFGVRILDIVMSDGQAARH
jgi:flagellar motor switch protein FliN/FliY